MQTLTEAKFPRTGKEYKLEKTETGFNLQLIDLDDELKPIFKTFAQLIELSQNQQIVFKGFEEKKHEAEFILLYLINKAENALLKTQMQNSEAEKDEEIALLKSEIDGLKSEIENQKAIIIDLQEAKTLIPGTEPES